MYNRINRTIKKVSPSRGAAGLMAYAYRREVTLYQKVCIPLCSRGKDIFDMRGNQNLSFYKLRYVVTYTYESQLKDPIVPTFETAHVIAELIKRSQSNETQKSQCK